MTPPAAAPRPWRRPARWAAALGGLAVVVALAAVAALWALLSSPGGTAWLLAKVPGLQAEGVQGALLSGRLAVQRLGWHDAAGRIDITGLELENPRWRLRAGAAGLRLALDADAVRAQRVHWQSAPAPDAAPPAAPPTRLTLPLELKTPVAVQTLQVDALAPVQALALQLHLGADDGRAHDVQALSLQWNGLTVQGQVRIGTVAPLPVQATLAVDSAADHPLPWQARLRAGGTLAALALEGSLRAGEASAGLSAELTPFARWPLAALQLRTNGLDLSTLAPSWPQTLLRGQVALRGGDGATPLEATLALTNDAPGRWNEGRLPVRQADARLSGRLDRPDTVAIEKFALTLADAERAAGLWQGSGRWQGDTLALQTRLDGLVPQRLDARAAAMQLGGTLKLVVDGLPSPDPAAAPAAGGAGPGIDVDAELQGRIDGSRQPVQLELQGRASAEAIALRRLAARSGQARLQAQGEARRNGERWAVRSEGELVEFDPLPWWPGPADSAWRRGPHRLNATWQADLSVPAAAGPAAALLGRLRGEASVTAERSLLAGVPLNASMTFGRAAPAGAAARLAGVIELGANRLQLDGEFDVAGDGRADRVALALQAPELAALAPLAGLHPALAEWTPRGGSAEAKAMLQGRWPALQTEGEARLRALRSPALDVRQASLAWQAGGAAPMPLQATLNVDDARYAGQRVPTLHAELDGDSAAHRLRIDAALPLQPPPALRRSLALGTHDGSWLQLAAAGAWSATPTGHRWAVDVESLRIAGWNGGALSDAGPPAATVWAAARDLRAEFGFGPDGALQRLQAEPGRLRLAEQIDLRWDELLYDTVSGQLQLQAHVDSFAPAPLLARWQPTLGWAGDLKVRASVDVRAAERFDADIVIERESGDLSVRDPGGNPLALGLSDLRLAVNAHDGVWYFTQALAGRTLGEMGGAVRVRSAPGARWPAPADPLDGTVQARVANLGVWGAWVPAGWRLQGVLETTASFGGRFDAPEIDGKLHGSGLGVRNLLEGVNVRDGEVMVRLEGDRATVERFSFQGGDGSLTITGGAMLGAEPSAQLRLVAERFQVLGRIDRRLVVSGEAALALQPQRLALDGQLAVDEGLFDTSRADAPSLDDDVVVRRPGAPEPDVDPEADEQRPRRQIDVAVGIDLGEQLRVRGRGLDARLGGRLRLTAPAGRPALAGTVRVIDGTYAAYGQELTIERGRISFSGPIDNPRLDVLALRPKLDFEVGVAITGTAQSPRVRLHSNPEMSDTDKLSWLVMGRDPSAVGRADTALLQRAAVALLAGEGQGPGDTLIRNLGLDDLSLRQDENGGTTETIVSLGKQLSQRWYVGYERGVNATTGTWQLIYRAAQRFTLRLQSGLDESLDAIWIWRVP